MLVILNNIYLFRKSSQSLIYNSHEFLMRMIATSNTDYCLGTYIVILVECLYLFSCYIVDVVSDTHQRLS